MSSIENFIKKYKFGFSVWGFGLFLLIMVPNIVYFCVPAYRGGLDGDNVVLDTVASVFQAIGLMLLFFIVRREKDQKLFKTGVTLAAFFFAIYLIAWIFYFCSYRNSAVVISLAVFPCLSLLSFSIGEKNRFSLTVLRIFSILHIVSAILLVA